MCHKFGIIVAKVSKAMCTANPFAKSKLLVDSKSEGKSYENMKMLVNNV